MTNTSAPPTFPPPQWPAWCICGALDQGMCRCHEPDAGELRPIDRNRLSDDDRRRIRDEVRSTYALWSRGRPAGTFAFNRQELRRRAARSIGCTLLDLRDSERDWLDAVIDGVTS
jgi:hypothetical protein